MYNVNAKIRWAGSCDFCSKFHMRISTKKKNKLFYCPPPLLKCLGDNRKSTQLAVINE